MAGAQFEYDEKGTTFYYFLLSFFGLILLPLTYYLWIYIKPPEKEKHTKRQCFCAPCLSKRDSLKKREPNHIVLRTVCIVVLSVLWALFAVGVYKVTQFERDFTEYDPYSVLELDVGATQQEIRRQYRRLSLKFHPDKEGGDPQKFMRIAKAYEALTDEESRKNWEEHGNPDGPSATTFGIALPSWLVSKENSLWVLGAYGLAFMVILPLAVGTWWYKSIQYSCDQILLDTSQIYYYFFHKTPNMQLRRVIMILAASMEFEKGHNNDVQERPSDNIELPELMRDLPNLGEKNKERPLCFVYSLKARALLHAHLSRLELPLETLKKDLELILGKCPYLIQEMVSVVAQLIAMVKAGRATNMPRLETLENVMKLSPMVVQGLWENKSALLQLPHLTLDNLRHFKTKKRNIRTIREFVSLKEDERRSLLRNLMDEQYEDIMNVCRTFPVVDVNVQAKVIDDEEHHITAGAIVTVVVNLTRTNLEEHFEVEEEVQAIEVLENSDVKSQELQDSPKAVSNKAWQKNKKKPKKGKPQPAKRKQVKQAAKKKTAQQDEKNKAVKEEIKNDENKENEEKNYEGDSEDNEEDSKENGDSGVYEENNKSSEEEEEEVNEDENKLEGGSDGEDEDEWDKLQAHISKKEKIPEAKSRESHLVHCPYFPEEKHEMWWIYLCDRKKQILITPPQQVVGFKDHEEVELRFQAPDKVGTYMYSACLRSDSYNDFDVITNFKIQVHEAKEIVPEQWEFDSDEDEDKDEQESGESEYTSEESDND